MDWKKLVGLVNDDDGTNDDCRDAFDGSRFEELGNTLERKFILVNTFAEYVVRMWYTPEHAAKLVASGRPIDLLALDALDEFKLACEDINAESNVVEELKNSYRM